MPSLNLVRSSSRPCHLSILYDLHQVHAISQSCTIFISACHLSILYDLHQVHAISHCTIFPSCTIFIKCMTYLHHVRSSHPVRSSSNLCHLSTMYYLPICMIAIQNDLPILYVCTHPHIIPPLCIIFPLCSICIQNHAICTSCTTRISTVPSLYRVKSFHPMKSFASIMPSLHPERSSHPARFSNQNPLVTLQCPIATATTTNKQTTHKNSLWPWLGSWWNQHWWKQHVSSFSWETASSLCWKGEFKRFVLTTVPPPVSRSAARGNICFTKSLPAAHFLLVYTDTYRRSSPIPTFPFVGLSTRSSQRHCQHVHVNTRICRCL